VEERELQAVVCLCGFRHVLHIVPCFVEERHYYSHPCGGSLCHFDVPLFARLLCGYSSVAGWPILFGTVIRSLTQPLPLSALACTMCSIQLCMLLFASFT
jgi:hypothetical protein